MLVTVVDRTFHLRFEFVVAGEFFRNERLAPDPVRCGEVVTEKLLAACAVRGLEKLDCRELHELPGWRESANRHSRSEIPHCCRQKISPATARFLASEVYQREARFQIEQMVVA